MEKSRPKQAINPNKLFCVAYYMHLNINKPPIIQFPCKTLHLGLDKIFAKVSFLSNSILVLNKHLHNFSQRETKLSCFMYSVLCTKVDRFRG